MAIPPAYHTLVQTSPDGVRKTLYIASHARRILGMKERESTQLINYLLNHAQQPEYQLGVKWKNVGDLVQWDNRCTMHRATAFEDQVNRPDMRRTTVYDHGLYAFGAKLGLEPGKWMFLLEERSRLRQTQRQRLRRKHKSRLCECTGKSETMELAIRMQDSLLDLFSSAP
jgi:hypothetical protein